VISLKQKAYKWSTLTRCVSSTYSKTERSPHQIQNSRDGRNWILEVRESHVLYKWRVTNHQAVPFLQINPPIMLCVNILKGLITKPKPVHRICKSFGAILENQDKKSTSNLLLWIKCSAVLDLHTKWLELVQNYGIQTFLHTVVRTCIFRRQIQSYCYYRKQMHTLSRMESITSSDNFMSDSDNKATTICFNCHTQPTCSQVLLSHCTSINQIQW
jgi:hypothetical protein